MANRSNSEQIMLKTIMFGGFDKAEVLTYIDHLRSTNEEKINQLSNQLSQISTFRNSLEENISSFEKTMSKLEQDLIEKNNIIKELSDEVIVLRTDVEKKTRVLSDVSKELEIQKSQNHTLSLNVNSYEHKSEKYDVISAQIGEVLLTAKLSANRIVQTAEDDASRINDHAFAASKIATEELVTLRSDIMDITSNIGAALVSLSERMDSVNNAIGSVLEKKTNYIKPFDFIVYPNKEEPDNVLWQDDTNELPEELDAELQENTVAELQETPVQTSTKDSTAENSKVNIPWFFSGSQNTDI